MKLIIFLTIFLGLLQAQESENFPIKYLCSSCVLYDTGIGDVFDDLSVKGPRPQVKQNTTKMTVLNAIMVDVDGKYDMDRNETVQIMTPMSTTIMLSLTVSIVIGLGNIATVLLLLHDDKKSSTKTVHRPFIRVQETEA